MRVVYGRRAQTDIGAIFDYIAQQDLITALAVETDIRKACDGLGQFPYANVATDLARVYRMPLPKRGFTVFYRVQARQSLVEIVRVVRSSRVKNLGRVPTG
jgi:plasmid stabilization system protein ParE